MRPQILHNGVGLVAFTVAFSGSVALAVQDTSNDEFDVLKYIDPLIGTANGGANGSRWCMVSTDQLMANCRACLRRRHSAFWWEIQSAHWEARTYTV